MNRLFFEGWDWIQIPLAAAACLIAWGQPGGRLAPSASGVVQAIILVLAAYAVPETLRPGGMIGLPDGGRRLRSCARLGRRTHRSYSGLDMLKFTLGLLVFGGAWRTGQART